MTAVPSALPNSPAELPVRLGARAIDTLVVALLAGGLGQAIGFGFDWLALGAGMILAYFVLLDAFVGATLGKLALGLRVVGPGGSGRASLREAVCRESFVVLGAIPFVGPLLAISAWTYIIVTIRKSPLRQGKHDMLAGGTQVVQVNRSPA